MNARGVVTSLADLPGDALVDAAALAAFFQKSVKTIFRRVRQGELPAPMLMGGKAMWIAGAIRAHLAQRQAAAIRAAEQQQEKRAADFR
jgi:predicted DNA-binding transcriptional regulator AlpA